LSFEKLSGRRIIKKAILIYSKTAPRIFKWLMAFNSSHQGLPLTIGRSSPTFWPLNISSIGGVCSQVSKQRFWDWDDCKLQKFPSLRVIMVNVKMVKIVIVPVILNISRWLLNRVFDRVLQKLGLLVLWHLSISNLVHDQDWTMNEPYFYRPALGLLYKLVGNGL